MSSVYSSEPPTTGKVILITNYGNIDVELWTKEAPRTCRNFIQLCLEKYYNNCIFHRIIKDFMIQTGDPGDGGKSIWGKEFADEFHSRLRFNHRGIVAMANKNIPNTNGSQFFITMDKCPWLDRKHTIFGKVVGDTYFNAHTISELPTKNDYPISDLIPNIIRIDVVINPFVDIIPRIIEEEKKKSFEPMKKSLDLNKLKNNNLISFDDEFEQNIVKIKPIHELVKNDKKLLNKPVVIVNSTFNESTGNSTINKKEKIIEKDIYNENDEEKSDIEIEEKKIDFNTSNQILELKKQICQIKKKNNKIDKEDSEEEIEKKLTPLQKLNAQYLNIKRGRNLIQDKIEKLNIFKNKLKNKDEESWMTNKLKFQIDSQKAYSINEQKQKQMMNYDIDPYKK
jgi:peptidyl-prolyl cis-trans isomerase SDCCAG10